MPFIPHTQRDIELMLEAIGVKSICDLFDEIPSSLLQNTPNALAGLNELQVTQLLQKRAAQNGKNACFIGAGAYEHHIPAAVWEIASRGEFLTAYTPYQAEASQGTLQLLYEYQSMMASLMGMEVSNASLYDGSSALGEAILMAIRSLPKNNACKTILIPSNIHPHYYQVVKALVTSQGIELLQIPFEQKTGRLSLATLAPYQHAAALVIPQPNFFGQLEDVDQLTDWAHAHNQLVIAVVNPIAMALFKEPGSWGQKGADIVCGEGQPLGLPLASGGPYFGFMCTRLSLVRQMPGRLIGRTVDKDGKTGFTLTLQAREQHIRRAKATSNICTNQGLAVTAATIFMSLLGERGLRNIALASYENTRKLLTLLQTIPGINLLYAGTHFHEAVIQLPIPASILIDEMAKQGIQAGYDLNVTFPQLTHALLICVTETKSNEDLEHYAKVMQTALTAVTHRRNGSAATRTLTC